MINYTDNKIKQPGEIFTDLCEAATNQRWDVAKEIAEDLANMGAQGIWLDLAYDIADGLKKITLVSERIFSIGKKLSEPQIKNIEKATNWVSNELKTITPTLVIQLESEHVPTHAITGINGFGFIVVNENDINSLSTLVHEITHSNLMSKSLFLDEGLATLMQFKVKNEDIYLEDKYWDRPNIAALIESDWSTDPYFSHVLPLKTESKVHEYGETTKVHQLAAYIVQLLIKSKGLPFLVSVWNKLKAKLKNGQTFSVIKEIFDVDLWKIEAELLKNTKANPINIEDDNISILELGTKALAENDPSKILANIKDLRIIAYKNNKNLLGFIKGLIVLGTDEKDERSKYFRSESLTLMDLAKSKGVSDIDLQIFEAYKNVLKLRNVGYHAINLRKIGNKTSEGFENLLNSFPDNPEVIIATAKSQLKSYYDILPSKVWKEKLLYVVDHHPFFSKVALKLLDEPKFN